MDYNGLVAGAFWGSEEQTVTSAACVGMGSFTTLTPVSPSQYRVG